MGRSSLQSPEFFLYRGSRRLFIGQQNRFSAHRIGEKAMESRSVSAGAAQPVNSRRCVTVDADEQAFEWQCSLPSTFLPARYRAPSSISTHATRLSVLLHDLPSRNPRAFSQRSRIRVATFSAVGVDRLTLF